MLYFINLIVPLFFLLVLDLASFFICEAGGEKLSFKVTVLLAVTVMQLILNEILPSSSDKVPLIGKVIKGPFVQSRFQLSESKLERRPL